MILNPLATRQQLAMTPTMAEGLTFDLEMELRALGCQMIQQMGVLLQLPQRTMAAAQIFFQRFWYTSSMCDFSADKVAVSALLLASKLEETQVGLRRLINAYHYVAFLLTRGARPSAYVGLAHDSLEVTSLRDTIVVLEMQMLKRLGFQMQVVLPHALLVQYLRVLGLTDPNLKVTLKPHENWDAEWSTPPSEGRSEETVSLAQCAWSFLNDALQTPVLCIFGPHVVACAAIALAAEMGEPCVVLPLEPAPWWLLFDASEPEIKIAASHLLWRYHHESSVPHLADLLDRDNLRSYIAKRPASPNSHANDCQVHKSW
ncbi:Cyclin, N-terminal [Kalmanozyma brasiliensis GHG001]|uniref:Cyclin-like domain-containing protein n=1 Tax=Kalmanozyma brasiliensis (strain GHG001) TaxID=1365824 RepID=V5ESY8_KALBG|nr:Cyclin, N-terminal [Kalmanozyma brasiliensis GHG001]EST05059.1 Cyclin, N-terminal [Kalmanozyma brasiliensis GHG001]